MTLRLIGFMCVVLFISLSAFSFLLSRSEDAIMEEVTKTVSTVGSKTLEVFGRQKFELLTPKEGEIEEVFVRIDGDERAATAGEDDGSRPHVQAPATEGRVVVQVTMIDGDFVRDIEWDGPRPPSPEEIEQRLESLGSSAAEHASLYVFAEGVEAEADREEVQARIPIFRSVRHAAGKKAIVKLKLEGLEQEEMMAIADGIEADGGPLPRNVASYWDEFTFQVPTRDYQSIFDAIRDRMLFLFLGVLAVGTVLSAGLARRFTRPIRELDRGLNRLSTGELDVEVQVSGNDEVARLGHAFNDMTRQLRAGRERAREVTRKEKLSALGRLAAGVAHDVRNPLHSINLTLQHVAETCLPTEQESRQELERSLGVIRDEIHRVDRLVENFLRFARTDRVERQPVDVGELLEETARVVEKEAEWRGISIQVDASGPLRPVQANLESLRSTLLNLVLNSFEAMPSGGLILLECRSVDDHVRIEVSDTGVGIPSEDHERVFEFGFTTREQGSGLGLAMVHQVVAEEHGGRVALCSGAGEGTRIVLELPLDAEPKA